MITLEQQLACARRELALRERVYPRQVALGKMSEAASAHETKCMYAIVQLLERLCAEAAPQADLFAERPSATGGRM